MFTSSQNHYHPARSLLGYEGLFSSVSSGREMTMVVADKKNRKIPLSIKLFVVMHNKLQGIIADCPSTDLITLPICPDHISCSIFKNFNCLFALSKYAHSDFRVL